jgi:hypothetical protein
MAVVAAVRALEELEGPRDGRGVNVTVNTAVGVRPITPGYVIRIRDDKNETPLPTLPASKAE